MASSDLPIDVVPNTSPPKFRWLGPNGRTPMEGSLPSSMEARVVELIKYARELEQQVKWATASSAEDALKSELYAATARIHELESALDDANRQLNASQTLNSNQRQMLEEQSAEPTARPKRGKS